MASTLHTTLCHFLWSINNAYFTFHIVPEFDSSTRIKQIISQTEQRAMRHRKCSDLSQCSRWTENGFCRYAPTPASTNLSLSRICDKDIAALKYELSEFVLE